MSINSTVVRIYSKKYHDLKIDEYKSSPDVYKNVEQILAKFVVLGFVLACPAVRSDSIFLALMLILNCACFDKPVLLIANFVFSDFIFIEVSFFHRDEDLIHRVVETCRPARNHLPCCSMGNLYNLFSLPNVAPPFPLFM